MSNIQPPLQLNMILEMFKTLQIPSDPFEGVNDAILKSLKLENAEDVTAVAVHTGFLLGVLCGRCCTEQEFHDLKEQMVKLSDDIKPPRSVINPDGSIDLNVAEHIINGT